MTVMTADLKDLGILNVDHIYSNLSYDELYNHELDSNLEGFERGKLTSSGTVAVDTGKFTGRSAKDKYIVESGDSKDNVWWKSQGSTNQPLSVEAWSHLKDICTRTLSGKKLYIMDGFCGANQDTRMSVRLVTEVAWQAHFFNYPHFFTKRILINLFPFLINFKHLKLITIQVQKYRYLILNFLLNIKCLNKSKFMVYDYF
mgnify:CR=1 FL=1